MKMSCPPVDALAELLELPRRDPRRAHLDQCPRCRARVAAFATFMAPTAAPGALPEDAEARLNAALDAAIGAGASEQSLPHPPRQASRDSVFGRLTTALRTPGLRPVFGVAVLVVAAGVIWLALPQRDSVRVLRGEPSVSAVRSAPAGLVARTVGDDVTLTWHGVAGVEGYEVVIYAPDLSELTRFAPVTDTSVVVAGEDLAAVVRGTALSWKVVVIERGDPAADSPLSHFRRP